MLIFFALLFITGMLILLFTINAIKRSMQSKGWPTTDGEIISSKMDTSTGMNTGLEYFDPRIEYKYIVQDQVYTSTRIYFGSQMGASIKENKIKTIMNKYPPFQKIKVFYAPDNHKLSVIEPGYHSDLNFGIIGGIILIIVSFTFLLI